MKSHVGCLKDIGNRKTQKIQTSGLFRLFQLFRFWRSSVSAASTPNCGRRGSVRLTVEDPRILWRTEPALP
jgi:hypothetical protein